ncbi:MAG: hypothetical protein QXY74_07720 [Candidatus Bathyarchaeia archaeon]
MVSWFQYPNILIAGDLRPPLINEAFTKRVLYTWDETDFGVPSIYLPRFLDPYYFLITFFESFGINLYFSQMITLWIMYFLASLLMYVYVKQLTSGDFIVAFVAALFLTSNIHLIVDREQTAIGFIDTALMILPCLATFARGIRTNSYMLTVISGILFNLTYGVFPNYRVTLLCLIALIITLLFLYLENGLTLDYKRKNQSKSLMISLNVKLLSRYLKLLMAFFVSVLASSIWIIILILTNMETLLTSYKNMAAPAFVLYLQPHDVIRLIAKWSFYEKGLGKPYVPYADIYFNDPLIIFLSYFPSILAFASLLLSKPRKLTIYFGMTGFLFLLLTSAFNPYLTQLYFALATHIPLMIAFRESTHWIFFVILSYGILIGVALSFLCQKLERKIWQILTISLVALLFISTSFPLTTGQVAENWLNPNVKGSYLPNSYLEVNNLLSNDYWSIFLPQRSVYVIYNFSSIPLGCGNPYPLIFSKPIITGSGTEYIQPPSSKLITKIYEYIMKNFEQQKTVEVSKFLGVLGIKYLVLEKSVIFGNISSVEDFRPNECESFKLIKQWSEIELFENVFALQKFYAADNLLNCTTIEDMYNVAEKSEWTTLNHSAFLNLTLVSQITDKTFAVPKSLCWREISPTKYVVNVESENPFLLVFLQNYDEQWKAYVNGFQISETNHYLVNAFANGWLIDTKGNLTITIQYEIQNVLQLSVIASVILPIISLLYLCRKEVKRFAFPIITKFLMRIKRLYRF